MNTEEKARRYDEALNWMREIYPGLHGATKEDAEHFFPELTKSEDERIRKAIESIIRVYGKTQGEWIAGYDMDTFVVHLRDAFACLEKQKDLDKMIVVSPEVWDNAISEAYENGKKEGEKQKEQKPAEWDDEDEEMLNSCISSIEESKENRYAYRENDGDTSYDREIAWLKALRSRPKSSDNWKPSEEQKEALEYVIRDYREDGCNATANYLQEILDHLKNM